MTNAEKFKTPEERADAFFNWCESNHKDGGAGSCLRESNCDVCHFEWLDMEAEEEKPLPCPLCGEECEVVGRAIRCRSRHCGYEYFDNRHKYVNETISNHNRVARAVGAGQKDENDGKS